jgi:molybdopterin-containing oxidoreductase family iron-sulfur binding subunit
MLAKNRDGRVIKVEGNPEHPVNRGRLCPRGQASVQGLYNPQRARGPMRKNLIRGQWDPISWEEAQEVLTARLLEIQAKGRQERIVFLSGLITGTLKELLARWMGALGSRAHIMYEPFAYESLREANRAVFGVEGIPAYHLDRADFLISFGADFLETWLSNVEYTHQFATFRSSGGPKKGFFVYAGPRLSLTGANADHWVSVPPGREFLIGLGVLRIILDEGLMTGMVSGVRESVETAVKEWSLDVIRGRTGVAPEVLRAIAHRFARARHPLALAGGVASSGPNGADTAVTANLLCAIHPGTGETMDWGDPLALGEVARAAQLRELADRMSQGEVDLLLIHETNPAFSLPPAWEFGKAMGKVPLVVSFSNAPDETSELAHMILPTHTPLESWGDHAPRRSVRGTMQPVMGPVFQTRLLADFLLDTGRKLRGTEAFPWKDFHQMLRETYAGMEQSMEADAAPQAFWGDAVRRGGVWKAEVSVTAAPSLRKAAPSFAVGVPSPKSPDRFTLVTYPTIQFFDGRSANRPWLQELPDPLTQITWGNWVEIHPETAARMGVEKGDMLQLNNPHGSIVVPAFPSPGIHPDALAMPIGQGHTAYGIFADGQPGNPVHLLPPEPAASGGLVWSIEGVIVQKTGRKLPIANTDGSPYQHGRGIAQSVAVEDYRRAASQGLAPHLRLPLPEGYDPQEDFYPPHGHVDYRWAMVVDLDRCIGCGACAVACYAENNVAIVGRNQVLPGREMSWLAVQRYWEEDRPEARFIPMLCQHCDHAPCESVCPVFAPHHSPEGINNQIFNRCIGTRYCSQNCPYKVRRFNFFTYTWPEPLNWQLNPDVTVRQKGVMEKCSFCIQRIKEAKNHARNEGRKVKDGEVTPACVQTCPAGVFAFGNLMDPESRVSRLIKDPRAYQVLGQLNTKPAVIYLKRVTETL